MILVIFAVAKIMCGIFKWLSKFRRNGRVQDLLEAEREYPRPRITVKSSEKRPRKSMAKTAPNSEIGPTSARSAKQALRDRKPDLPKSPTENESTKPLNRPDKLKNSPSLTSIKPNEQFYGSTISLTEVALTESAVPKITLGGKASLGGIRELIEISPPQSPRMPSAFEDLDPFNSIVKFKESPGSSKVPTPTNITDLNFTKSRFFTQAEINRLGRRFRKLDLDSSGTLTLDEFLSIPEVNNNPLAERVISCFDTDKDGVVDFKEFVEGMAIFTTKEKIKEKLRFAFKIYDIDNDGKISNGELFQVLKMMVGDNLDDLQLQQVVDHTINLADQNGDGKLDFKEFYDLVNANPILFLKTNMVISGF